MWFVRNPERLKEELARIESLRDEGVAIKNIERKLLKDFKFAIDFDLVLNSESLPFTLKYPDFFPETPPSIIPRDGRRLSDHQYGESGELCLEFRSDNWNPSICGSDLVASAYRLITRESPAAGERAIVPSDHQETLGQRLRGQKFRFLLTRTFLDYVLSLTPGSSYKCSITEFAGPNSAWLAHVRFVGDQDNPVWKESVIPQGETADETALLVRVESLSEIQICDQASFEEVMAATSLDVAIPENPRTGSRIAILTDGVSARLYYSFPGQEARKVIVYTTVDVSADRIRQPLDYLQLRSKKVGIVGAGSLGSKIATSLARCGVSAFVVLDDDILMPGNLTRNELDVHSVGAHKVDGLASRLRSVASDIKVDVRRVQLGGQESSGATARAMEALGTCDLLIDATADAQAFNFAAAVACQMLRPMIFVEVYAGGIGGFVCRVRPGHEPPPHTARNQYLAWCEAQGVPWIGADFGYETRQFDLPPMLADDADVGVIASHTSRMAIDVLLRPDGSIFPHSAYVIGLGKSWIFDEPFDTRPIDLDPASAWRTEVSQTELSDAIDYLRSILSESADAG